MITADCMNAVRKIAVEYSSIDQVNVARRPNRSDTQLNTKAPINMPKKNEARKLAKLFQANNPALLSVKMSLVSPSAMPPGMANS